MEFNNLYDLIVIGGGPAGLTAAIYMARAKYKTLILEKEQIGGQIAITEEVVNFPGVFKTGGFELTQEMLKQAKAFGAEVKMNEVLEVKLDQEIKEIITRNGTYKALSVIIATGANPRKLGFKGEEEYRGRGVSYCATCDGHFFNGKDIFVIGGGYAAAEEAMFLTRYGKSVTMIVRKGQLGCAASIIEKVENHQPKININYFTEVQSIEGEMLPSKITFINNQTKELSYYENKNENFGIFVFAGYAPNTELVKDIVALNEQGYIITDKNQKTNLDGVFAAGDVCVKDLRQVVTATSDGAIAATNCEKVVSQLHKTLNIPSLVADIDHKPQPETVATIEGDNKYIDNEMIAQIKMLFGQLESVVTIKAHLFNNELSKEEKAFLSELADIDDHVKIAFIEDLGTDLTPYIEMSSETFKPHYRYYGVPGGHEFTSFLVTVHRLFGPLKELNEASKNLLNSLDDDFKLDVVISLECTKCPALIMTLASILRYNSHFKLNIYDIAYEKELRDKYQIMSVPAMIINDEKLIFGDKSIEELLEIFSK
ncbi:MAG: FAD-dependent oxidoreductase [Erysipelotrichaceae bacterium]|nr:FAD-dependent oxidoreductase [Erysipelotrichaceae bacterium]